MTFKKIVEPQNFNNFKMKQSFNSKFEGCGMQTHVRIQRLNRKYIFMKHFKQNGKI